MSGEPGCDGDSAIGAATAPSPTGPWTDTGHPVVAPRRNGPGCNFLWTFDPAPITEPDGRAHLYYGSYYGGVQVRDLDLATLTTSVATATQVVIPNRLEGTFVVRRGGWYYLMARPPTAAAGRSPATASSRGARAARSGRSSTASASRSPRAASAARPSSP